MRCGGKNFGGLTGFFGEMEEGCFQTHGKNDGQKTRISKHHTYDAIIGGTR